ncbi:MAG: [citrate (pro-3S)-lyase] ligase [Deltaproteobacteria bacterium]|nr:[citrate (pro-3S)-lyase] ligase [Deltaproteobacteria bacterium]
MNGSLELEVADLDSKREIREVTEFLNSFGLEYEGDLDYTVILRNGPAMVATGSFKGEVLKNFAVNESFQGQGLMASLVTALTREQTRRGIVHFFVFTDPRKAFMFSELGFSEIARIEPYVALLETGLGSIDSWILEAAKELAHLPPNRAALVMNCNPLTKGHEALIRRAASENKAVIVFLVSEDLSFFSFKDRFFLVKESLGHLKNVSILPSGKYMISAATFPTYFLKKDQGLLAQTKLDLAIFAKKIAPALNIVCRYVGQEPSCEITRAYNQAMLDILPSQGIEVKVMPRLAINHQPVSASLVREAWKSADWETVSAMVPPATMAYLQGKTP